MTVSRQTYNLYQQLTSARLVSTTNLVGTYYNGQSNNGVGAILTASSNAALTVDSTATNNGDRLLLAGQTAALQNGLWDVVSAGSAGAPWILQRSSDFHSIEQMKAGQFLSINAGAASFGQMYVLTAPLPAAVGVNNITFTVVGGGGASGTVTFTAPSIANNIATFSNTTGNIQNGGAVASFQLAANIKAVTSANIGGAGGGPLTITQAGVTTSSVIVANISTSSNPVSVAKITPGTGNFTVLFSGDPGAACVLNYIVFIAAQ